MQVSHVHDHVTHAVISGHQTIDFGISSSAEFFHILSSTLYKDQILAVVREVLCNAWDAHIEAGCTDKPVEITLTPELFVIRDFGTGIHHDDMGTIYGTYGNSTKKNDGKQTGGFGLGCKAPFAYTDHFEVISHHDGVRTLYNLSKSSGQAMGKPGIIPIASFPTTETGLQVSIAIKNQHDFSRFRQLIERIARNGDMHMTLNGTVLERIGFDAADKPYLVLRDQLLDYPSRIMVRYGNVVYPVDQVKEIYTQYSDIVTHLNKLGDRNHTAAYSILFQAPPHSISVTPSRESLSMQEHTLNTLRSLFKDFMQVVSTEFPVACDRLTRETAQQAAKNKHIGLLLNRQSRLPTASSVEMLPPRITDLSVMARRYLSSHYPNTIAFRKKDLTYRLQAMVQEQLVDRGLVQTFLRTLQKIPDIAASHTHIGFDWLQRQVIRRVISKLLQAGMDTKQLYVYDPEDTKYRWSHETIPLTQAKEARPENLFAALPYLRNIMVVTSSKTNLTERINRHSDFQACGSYPGFLVYQTSMKKADKEAALAFFAKIGMKVIDLTVKQLWEIDQAVKKAPPAPRKPPKEGVPALKGMLLGSVINTRFVMDEQVERITDPEFIVQVSLRKGVETDQFEPWGIRASRYIIDLFGDKGAVTNNSAIADKWIAKGVKTLDDYILEKVLPIVEHSAAIHLGYAHSLDRIKATTSPYDRSVQRALELIYQSAELRALFGLPAKLSGDEAKYLHLWKKYLSQHSYKLSDEAKRVCDLLADIPLESINLEVRDKIKNSPLRELLSLSEVESVLKNNEPDSAVAKTTIEILGKLFS